MSIRPIRRSTISEQVFEQLKEQLIEGAWKQGDKIPSENELAVSFGVSRVTVRNALQKLAALNLIETRLGEGSFVRRVEPGMFMNNIIPTAYLSDRPLTEVQEYRQLLEGKTAQLATLRATPEDLAALEKIYQEMQLYKEEIERFSAADLDFHLKLAKITGNSLIIETQNIFRDILMNAMKTIVRVRGNEQGLYYHRKILEAMYIGDAQKAMQYMQQHMDEAYDDIMEQI